MAAIVGSVSKFMSVNVGALNAGRPPDGSKSASPMSMSKSVGNGSSVNWSSFCFCCGVSGFSAAFCSGAGLPYGWSKLVWPMATMCSRLRRKCGRNSLGISFGNGVGAGSGVAAFSSVDSVEAAAGLANSFLMRSGTGMVNSGFLLRITNVVVATYRGRAANIKMPKTKPGKPRNWAWNRRCHWVPLNMLKLNRPYKIAHMTAI